MQDRETVKDRLGRCGCQRTRPFGSGSSAPARRTDIQNEPLPALFTLHRVVAACIALATLTTLGQTDEQLQIERRLKAEYEGKVLLLRHFYQGDRLKYTIRGESLEGERPGIWTVDGRIKIVKLRWGNRTVEIEGDRLTLVYDDRSQEFKDQKSKQRVRVLVEAPSGSSEENIRQAFGRIFLASMEPPAEMAPTYWSAFLTTPKSERRDLRRRKPDYGEEVFVSGLTLNKGGSISAPRTVSVPDPNYTKVAREAKLQGTVVLSVVVTKEGTTDRILIVKPLGMGLDEAAVEVVSRWKFRPALRDGQPLAAHVNIEVNFRLY